MKTKTLYISDLDGTLLNDESRVSEYSAEKITQLCERGAMITIATARTPATADILLKDCKINVPMIVITGAATWLHDVKRYSTTTIIQRTLLEDLLNDFESAGISPFVYAFNNENGCASALDVYHKYPTLNPREQDFYADRKEVKRFFIGEDVPQEKRENVILLFAIGSTSAIMPLADTLRKKGLCSVSAYPDIFDPNSSLIEVFAPGVSKANAVINLKKAVGADRIVVFGDNLNDISMMKVADVAVAVENAYPEVKDVADIVIGRNIDDAVVNFIEKDFAE